MVSGRGIDGGATGEEWSVLESGLILVTQLIQVVATYAQNTAEYLHMHAYMHILYMHVHVYIYNVNRLSSLLVYKHY